jgi:hypothetical protein
MEWTSTFRNVRGDESRFSVACLAPLFWPKSAVTQAHDHHYSDEQNCGDSQPNVEE